MKIRLETRDGGHVRDGEIPPFDPPPEVIFWGTRVFVLVRRRSVATTLYREGMPFSLDAADAMLAEERR